MMEHHGFWIFLAVVVVVIAYFISFFKTHFENQREEENRKKALDKKKEEFDRVNDVLLEIKDAIINHSEIQLKDDLLFNVETFEHIQFQPHLLQSLFIRILLQNVQDFNYVLDNVHGLVDHIRALQKIIFSAAGIDLNDEEVELYTKKMDDYFEKRKEKFIN